MAQTTLRLTDEDEKILDALQQATGIGSKTDIIRLALRKLATAEGVSVSAPSADKAPKTKAGVASLKLRSR